MRALIIGLIALSVLIIMACMKMASIEDRRAGIDEEDEHGSD